MSPQLWVIILCGATAMTLSLGLWGRYGAMIAWDTFFAYRL